ncbi:YqaA family protein [Campylobacter troglodytis]|uniref:YqaA family protein n=1 Tax=Campylobacter troglodytis TaxID=654363 RepID=UPI001156E6A5|nr:VTT domain-containing protein [Campylobacter troglodytis]TQR53033.1 DedA family protein [Campylobacter troglodytis]
MFESLSYLYLFVASFISASLYPMASEAFVVGLLLADFSPLLIFFVASLGNTLGAMSTYLLAFFGKSLFLKRHFNKALKRLEKYDLSFKKFGFVFAFFSFLPLVGDLFVLALGLSKYPFFKALFFIALGKACRYGILIYITLYLS